MKATRETQDLKEELQKKEQMRQAAKKREEKAADLEAKRRIKEQIEADKRERQRKADEAKALREGRSLPPQDAESSVAPAPAAPKPKTSNTNEARLKLQTSQGVLTKTLPADTTLFEVAQMIEQEQGIAVTSFSINFPRKTFTGGVDFSKTLKEAGFVPSAAVNVK